MAYTSLCPLFAQEELVLQPHGKRLNRTIYTTFIFYSVGQFYNFILYRTASWLDRGCYLGVKKKRLEDVIIATNDKPRPLLCMRIVCKAK